MILECYVISTKDYILQDPTGKESNEISFLIIYKHQVNYMFLRLIIKNNICYNINMNKF